VTTSFPRHADDAAGHFVAAELSELPAGEITVFAPGPAQRERRQIGERHVTVQWIESGDAFGWPGLAARVREDKRRTLGAAAFVQRARAAVRSFAPTHVVAHWALPSAWPIAPRGVPVDVISHGADVRLLRALPLRAAIVRRVMSRAASWRFVSEALLAELTTSLPAGLAADLRAFASVRAPTVACAVDDANAAALRATIDGPMYVSVGRLVATKRVDRIVRHVAQAAPDATLVVVGDGPERPALEAMAERAGLRTRFVGERPRSEALAWIRAADWLCFASECEGASCVLSEAAALGTPVLSLQG
jgi:glycosyltransferase involved in cell wall biosynthesis